MSPASPALPLRAALVRGALVTLANWPAVLIEFASESLYKLALVVPVVGGALVATVMGGGDLRQMFAEGVRAAAGGVISTLTRAPIALIGFVLAVVVVAVGGSLIMFALKSGTLAVLIAGERQGEDVERLPLGYGTLARMHAYSIERLLRGVQRFARRSMMLSLLLSLAYTGLALAYVTMVAAAVRLAARPDVGPAWPLVVAVATAAAILGIAFINVLFDLMRIVVVGEDCGIREAGRRLWMFLIADTRQVVGIFAVVTILFALAAAASLLVFAGLALVAWVPFVGLIVIPLQAAAWLIRGLIFQFMALSALSAYQAQFRRFRAFVDAAGPAPLRRVGT